MFDALRQDLRDARRSFRRSPAFTLAVVVTLAVSIGANAALFSVLNAIVLRRLPVREPQRLVAMSVADDKGQDQPLIYQTTFDALRAGQRIFAGMTLYAGGGILPTVARGVQVDGLVEATTPEYYALLGVTPLVGRLLSPADAPASGAAAPVVVLGARFWQRHYAGDPEAIGETLVVSGVPLTIIGVTPPDFHGLQVDGGADFLVSLATLRTIAGDPRLPLRGWNIIARLAPGVSLQRAQADIAAAWPSLQTSTLPAGLSPTQREQMRSLRARVEAIVTGFSSLRRKYASPLAAMVGLAAMLLAIGCANLGGLLLARAVAKDQQIAIRAALGASRTRLVQSVVVESLLLSLAGTAAAIPLAWWTSRWLAATLWAGASTPLGLSMTPDRRVFAVTLVVAVVVALLVSVLPAWLATRPRAGIRLETTRSASPGTRSGRVLLVAQVALSMVLLVGALLFARSLTRLRGNDALFSTRQIVWARLWLKPGQRAATLDAAYWRDLEQQLSTQPGHESVAFSMVFPTSFNFTARLETVTRAAGVERAGTVDAIVETISPRFFETVGIARRRGRDFAWTDDERSAPVAIVNASLAAKLFDGDAVGRTIAIGPGQGRPAIQIVGVADDAPIGNFREPHTPVVFRPLLQEPQRARVPVLSVRTRSDVESTVRAMKAVASSGPHYIRSTSSLEEQVTGAVLQERLLAWGGVAFAVVAALLASVGVYSLIAYGVARRVREIGVRMALGASSESIWRMTIGEGLALVAIGAAIGIPAALAVGRLMRSLLYGLGPSDPIALAGAGAIFAALAIVAGWLPARRASRLDPMQALRQD